jgi:propionyl-CoA synthetase
MVPLAFAVLHGGERDAPELAQIELDLVALVREELGPIAALKKVHVIPALPKTRSGKILRGAVRALANGEDIETPPTIENPETLRQIKALF